MSEEVVFMPEVTWRPNWLPNLKQKEWVENESVVAHFGGTFATGKTEALLVAALRHIDLPRYQALVTVRRFSVLNLPGGILDKCQRLLAGCPGAVFKANEFRWSFESGAELQFGYCDHEADEERYCGGAYSFVGLDNVEDFTPKQIALFRERVHIADGVHFRFRTTGRELE